MAQSRLEKIASIFARISSLRKGGIMKDTEVPMWYNIYESFPPKYDPYYDRPVKNQPIQPIFYPEDIIRAKFQAEYTEACYSSLHNNSPSRTQQFLHIYEQKQKEGIPDNDLYTTAIEEFKAQYDITKKTKSKENEGRNTVEMHPTSQKTININLNKEFLQSKEE